MNLLFTPRVVTVRVFAALLLVSLALAARAQGPVIASFSRNGELVATNIPAGWAVGVEWAPSVNGPWTNSWAGLTRLAPGSNGTIRVSVPMFYRLREAAPTNMVLIPAGSFAMGDTFSEGSTVERPVHTVTVGAFYMDRTEVTKAQWDEVYAWAVTHGYNFDYADSGQGKASNHPAQSMTWWDAVKWCNARSEKEGRVPAYYTESGRTNVYRFGQLNVQNGWVRWTGGYRLPTEAEWEKAARGGVAGQRFWFGNTITHLQANYYSITSNAYDVSSTRGYHPTYSDGVTPYTSPVGSFAANGYGLSDMVGNVYEWCWDWYEISYYITSPAADPQGPTTGSDRVLRGGCWSCGASAGRSASRIFGTPGNRDNSRGFRAVLPPGMP